VVLLSGVAWSFFMLGAERVSAQPWQGDDAHTDGEHPVYQWHASDGHRHEDRRDRRDFRRDTRFMSPQVSAGWFQRPYPYHLDYYRMRYGGSYAPYFGNLYGTPQVVNYAPYYGPYYTGYGAGNAEGFGQPGYNGIPMEYPANPGMTTLGNGNEGSIPAGTQTGQPPAKSGGEALPAPTP
jgi:hypothetical protein